jgi:hypothetical protein
MKLVWSFVLVGCSSPTTMETMDAATMDAMTDASPAMEAAADTASQQDTAMPEAGPTRALGTVMASTISCAAAGNPGGAQTCWQVDVSCPGTVMARAYVALVNAQGTLKGTVDTHNGSGGNAWLLTNSGAYKAAGLQTAAIRWDNTVMWEDTGQQPRSIKVAACRPATVIQWIFDTIHQKHRDSGFCGEGYSGGSGVMSYALASYGMGDYFDYVMLSQGPPFGRMDCGCGAPNCTPPALCPEISVQSLTAAMPLPGNLIDQWEGTIGCGKGTLSMSDFDHLHDDSVDSNDDTFAYPKTHVSGWYCAQQPNGTPAGGAFFLSRVTPQPTVYCSPNCKQEDIYNQAATLSNNANVVATMISQMSAECIPRHM